MFYVLVSSRDKCGRSVKENNILCTWHVIYIYYILPEKVSFTA